MTMLELLVRLEEDVGLIDIYRGDGDDDQLYLHTIVEVTPELDAEIRKYKVDLVRFLPKASQQRPGSGHVELTVMGFV